MPDTHTEDGEPIPLPDDLTLEEMRAEIQGVLNLSDEEMNDLEQGIADTFAPAILSGIMTPEQAAEMFVDSIMNPIPEDSNLWHLTQAVNAQREAENGHPVSVDISLEDSHNLTLALAQAYDMNDPFGWSQVVLSVMVLAATVLSTQADEDDLVLTGVHAPILRNLGTQAIALANMLDEDES